MSKNFYKEIGWILKDKYGGKLRPEIENDIKRLKKGEPVDYIVGWKPFLNCEIDLSFKPLIPRPETEFWVEKVIAKILDYSVNAKPLSLKIADVFAGSGCVGISVLKNVKNSKVDFYEIDSNLIKQIKLNLKINRINKSRYRVIRADIFTARVNPSGKNIIDTAVHSLNLLKDKYDFILANPPYVALKRKNRVQKEVLKYEPKKALFSGKDGLKIIKKFLKQTVQYIKPTCQIWMEFDSFQKPLIGKILKQLKYKKWIFYKDQYKKWRFVKIIA
ncbi:MAG: HemK family protein methyltransferase [Patescibacteria group bacterium]